MKLSKIVKHLGRCLKKNGASNAERCEDLDDLISELKKKERKNEKALASEKGSLERKQLKLEHKIISVELRKAKQRRNELAGK